MEMEFTKIAFFAATIAALVAVVGTRLTQETPAKITVVCYEDSALFWNPITNAHDTCWSLDDYDMGDRPIGAHKP